MIRRNKPLPLLLMFAVIGSGVIIGALGIYLVSQQKSARLLDTAGEYAGRTAHIAAQVEAETRSAVDNVFRQLQENPPNPGNPEGLLQLTKTLLLNNPIVKNPFFITHRNQFLFPISRKTALPEEKIAPIEELMTNPRVKTLYLEGYRFEYRRRNFVEALESYRETLAAKPSPGAEPYAVHAVARCYFKLNKFAQAAYYYRRVLSRYPRTLEKDTSLHMTVLRHLALAHKQQGAPEDALPYYLDLYEKVLEYDVRGKTNPFAFYKNEAREFLNRRVRKNEKEEAQEATQETPPPQENTETGSGSEPQPAPAATPVERLRSTPELDVSLSWSYFEFGAAADQGPEPAGPGDDTRYLKLRELYESSDEKTQFYKALKNNPQWFTPPYALTTPAARIEQLENPYSRSRFQVAYKLTVPDHPQWGAVYFGFMLSPAYIRETLVPQVTRRFLEGPSLYTTLSAPGQPGLASAPFQTLFPGKQLVLHSKQEDFFESIVKKEIRLYYFLLFLLMGLLVSGIFLFYKYLSREAQLVRLKADFVDSVSHTLKTPLTRMSLLAENIVQGWVTDEEKKKEFFETIISETGRMSEMIDNMLNFSRIEEGKQHYQPEKTYLQETVHTVLDDYSAYIKNHRFQVELHIGGHVPAVMLDPKAAKLIIGNLVQNALKYSPEEKHIHIEVSHSGGEVFFVIRDRGIGIPAKQIPLIFKKFSRAPGDTVKSIEGSGLGLFLVRHAVEAHQGRIEVTAGKEKGTVFRVYFPCAG